MSESEPTWKDAHDALSAYVTTLVSASTLNAQGEAFRRYRTVHEAVLEAVDNDPHWERTCSRCGRDRTAFPGTEW